MSNAVDAVSRSLDEVVAMLKKLQPGELSEEQHDTVESKAIYAVSALRSIRNMASLVHRLPLEVLGLIFRELILQLESQDSFIPWYPRGAMFRAQPARTVSMVSRRWREAALSFPGLWSTVYAQEGDRGILKTIERSGNTLLRIFVFSGPPPLEGVWPLVSRATTNAIPTINTIVSHSHRIRELHLVDMSIELLNETNLVAVSFPRLEGLTLVMDSPVSGVGDVQSFSSPTFIFNDVDVPRLKKATLIRCWPFLDDLKRFRGLTHLCLAFTLSHTSIAQVMDTLRALPDLEEFCLAQVTFTGDSTAPVISKVVLERLRVMGLGRLLGGFRISDFLQYVVLPSDVEIFIWGIRTESISRALRRPNPFFVTSPQNVRELRLTAPYAGWHSQITIPTLRSPRCCAIISNPSAFQLDGDFAAGPTLLSKVPDLLDLSYVRELWLGQRYNREPSRAEWRLFFTSVPALDTMVIVDRPSHPIVSALSLSEGDASSTLPCTSLRTIRILDCTLSVIRLSLFLEQRDRMGFRLDLCEILSSSPPLQSPLNDMSDEAHYDENSSRNEAMVADLTALKDYVGDVTYSVRCFSPLWDVLPSPVFDWLRRIWNTSLYE